MSYTQSPTRTCLGAPRSGTHLPGLVHAVQALRELGQDVPGRLQGGTQSGIVPGQLLLPLLVDTGKKRVTGTKRWDNVTRSLQGRKVSGRGKERRAPHQDLLQALLILAVEFLRLPSGAHRPIQGPSKVHEAGLVPGQLVSGALGQCLVPLPAAGQLFLYAGQHWPRPHTGTGVQAELPRPRSRPVPNAPSQADLTILG